MLQRSPILRFALEVFEHALESAVSGRARDRKLAVINLAQSIELAVKAALVEKNSSIYTKDGKTVNTHEALKLLAGHWSIERLATHSRIEVLIDERNSIQHRYGDVDDVTLDYHMETAFRCLDEVLRREFDIELSDWVQDNVDPATWKRVRFVQVREAKPAQPSDANLPGRSPALDLVDGFSKYESSIRELIAENGEGSLKLGSTLDFAIKAMASLVESPQETIRDLPGVYRLRNRVIHGEYVAQAEEVVRALKTLDSVLGALRSATPDLVRRALATVRRGVRGARVLTWIELQELDESDSGPDAKATKEGTHPPGTDTAGT